MHELDFPTLSASEAVGLRSTLTELVHGVDEALGSTLFGIYLVGSFALGAGDDQSDVDFAVVTRHPIAQGERNRLSELHGRLPDAGTHGSDHLEGSYLCLDELARDPGQPWIYVDNGSRNLEQSSHDNTHVFRWVLRQHGIRLVGPDPVTFVDKVDDEDLRREAHGRAVDWHDLLHANPEIVRDSWAQTHFVTGLCRLLYTATTASVASKAEATQWAAQELEPRWTPLLLAAQQSRTTTWARMGANADDRSAQETVELSEEILRKMR